MQFFTFSKMKYNLLACVLLALASVMAGCNLPLPESQPTATSTPVPPGATALPPTKTALPPTPYPISPTPPPPSVTPTKPSTALSGFVVFDQAKSEVTGVDFATGTELFTYSVPNAGWLGQGTSQVLGSSVYYFSQKDQAVYKVNQGGISKLDFLPKEPSLSFLLSPDGKQIAWALDKWGAAAPGSELWIAASDGSGAKKVAVIDPADNARFMVLKPYRWQPDGRLVFNYSPTGIGGYILFGGFGGASVYDPASGKTTVLLAHTGPGAGGLCLQGISLDLTTVASTCATKTQSQLSLISTQGGKVTQIPTVPDQGQTGSLLYSPGMNWIAYAVARGEPDKESGKALLLPAAGGTPKVLAAFATGYAVITDWVDEDRLLLERWQGDAPGIWVIQRDGTGLVKLADGTYVGAIR